MTVNTKNAGAALLWIFTASGFAGLIYESIWAQYLGLILGHSAYAQVLVLALFMGGMALGAWLVSRRSELLAKPLVAYALVEFLLGIMGVGFHAYYQLISGWSYNLLFPALAAGMTLELARWLVAALLILPQCVLLGMTFPLMSAGYIRLQPGSSGRVLAGLYFSNSLGAAAGALASTFLLLPAVGLPGTVLSAGILNILVAILVWPLAKQDQPSLALPQPSIADRASRSAPAFILAVAAITGASSFVYEVSWVRMLSMVLGGTIHAFELMLAAFISGIAFGGLWLRRRADGVSSPRRAAGWAQIAMGCMALSTLFLYNESFSWVAWVIQTLNVRAESAYSLYNIASAMIALVIMFPTAFFAGMTLPLLTLTLLRDGNGEAAIGKVYAANTLGAITGVVIAVFIAMPLLGLRMSLWFAAAADILIGVLLLVSFGRGAASGRGLGWRLSLGVATSGALLVAALVMTRFDPLLMSSAVFRSGNLPKKDEFEVLYHQDGRTASATVREVRKGQRSIFTNGKPDASISFDQTPALDEITMMVAGVIPMLHQPQAKSVAIIGFGSGMTTHFVLGNPDIESVDTIEIEPAMVEAAQHFRPIIERAYSDSRSHVVIDDAKSYFATQRKRYDIIISEPSNPWVSGVASLFTEEFYAFIPDHLNENGVFAQWVQAYEMTPLLMNSIIRAMLPHFADVRLFAAGETDWLLVASPKRQFTDMKSVSIPAHWPPKVRQELAERGIARDEDVALLFHGGLDILRANATLYPGSGVNSDYFPILQLGAAKARFNQAAAVEPAELRVSKWPVFEVLGGVEQGTAGEPPTPALITQLPLASRVQKAQALEGALSGTLATPRLPELLLDEKLAVERLRSAGLACQLDALGNDGLVLIARLASLTTPYLPPDTGRALWNSPDWVRCTPQETLTRDFLGLVAAVAARDHRQVLGLGAGILVNPDSLAKLKGVIPAFEYLVGGMQLAALASHDFSQVLQLQDRFGKELEQNYVRRMMLQTAADKLASSRGQTGGSTPSH